MNLTCALLTIVLISSVFFISAAYSGEITDSEHRTKAATEKLPALVCYRCDTMSDGERCRDLKENSTHFHANCSDDARICQVNRISMTTINKTGDMMGKQKLWMLQRNCTGSCDPGCIIIGERTKLYSCTTCCEESFCNYGNAAESITFNKDLKIYVELMFSCISVMIITLIT